MNKWINIFRLALATICIIAAIGIGMATLYYSTHPEVMTGTTNFLFWEVDEGFYTGFMTMFMFSFAWWIRDIPIESAKRMREDDGL